MQFCIYSDCLSLTSDTLIGYILFILMSYLSLSVVQVPAWVQAKFNHILA